MKVTSIFLAFLCITLSTVTFANGVLRNGQGARSTGLAGADVVFPDDPLAVLNSHPAAMTDLRGNILQLNLTAGLLDAEYDNAVSSRNEADRTPGLVPEAAYVHHTNGQVSWGVSFSPVSAVEADWEIIDPPGALGSYGRQTYKSSFIAFRSALGLAWEINPQWSIGASGGLVYNRNRLKAPYIFQTATGLAGAKVLVNLEADGFGANGVFSTRFKPMEAIELNLSYTTPTWFDADGTLRGTSDPVIGVGSFRYDATVETGLPQIVSGGLLWQITEPLKLGFQVDWINWDNAFAELPITLTNGSNGSLPPSITDIAPLDWDDQLVFHIAGEYAWSNKLTLRAGYSYAENAVPAGTLTPTTAAIMEHSLGFGFGYRKNNVLIDVGYQWNLPNEESVGTSQLRFDEFNNSRTDVSIHYLSIGISLIDPFWSN